MLIPALLMLALATKPTSHPPAKTAEAAGKYLDEKKEQFEARVDKRLGDLSKDVDELKGKAKKTQEQAEAEWAKHLAELDTRRAEARRKFEHLQKTTGNAWRDLKGGVEAAVDDLEKGVEKARGK